MSQKLYTMEQMEDMEEMKKVEGFSKNKILE